MPVQDWTCPEGSRQLKLSDFKTICTWMLVRLLALRIGRLYPTGNIPGTHFCWEAESTPGSIKRPEGLCQWKIPFTIGNRTHDLPTCSAVPQPTVPPRARSYEYILIYSRMRRSHWPLWLRRRSAVARLLRFWVQIPPGVMDVCCECCVLSGRGLCDGLITRPEESYRLWCVVVCDLETSWMRGPWPTGGAAAPKTNKQTQKCIFYPKLEHCYFS